MTTESASPTGENIAHCEGMATNLSASMMNPETPIQMSMPSTTRSSQPVLSFESLWT